MTTIQFALLIPRVCHCCKRDDHHAPNLVLFQPLGEGKMLVCSHLGFECCEIVHNVSYSWLRACDKLGPLRADIIGIAFENVPPIYVNMCLFSDKCTCPIPVPWLHEATSVCHGDENRCDQALRRDRSIYSPDKSSFAISNTIIYHHIKRWNLRICAQIELDELRFFSKTSGKNFRMKLYLEHQLGAVVAARDADRRTVNKRDIVEGGEYCNPSMILWRNW